MKACLVTVLVAIIVAGSPLGAAGEADPPGSTTGLLERFHRAPTELSPGELRLAARLAVPPDSVGYHQSTIYPLRVHYHHEDFQTMAQEVLAILEYSWQVQVEDWGFPAPPPDCGLNGSDDLDVFIESLPAGLGGYAAFACYVGESSRAASFVVLADNLTPGNIRGATTHEFNHVLQNAVDYWESITFKENTATWAMDLVYPDENYYFNYLRFFQRNPDWSLSHFSTTNAYQYGGCLLPHFISEYYHGDGPELMVDWWERAAQVERVNEPDYLDALTELLTERSGGMDDLMAMLKEFALWRYACGPRDDGAHFQEGGAWGGGAELRIDTVVDLAGLPFIGQPTRPPQDLGMSFFELSGAIPGNGLMLEFQGDPAVDWAVGLIQGRADPREHRARWMNPVDGHGMLPLGAGEAEAVADLAVVVINGSTPEFDPEQSSETPRSFTLTVTTGTESTRVTLLANRRAHGSGDDLELGIALGHDGGSLSGELYLVLEVAGGYLFLPDLTETPAPLSLPLSEPLTVEAPLLELELPEAMEALPLRWHAALLEGDELIDYHPLRTNLVPHRRASEGEER